MSDQDVQQLSVQQQCEQVGELLRTSLAPVIASYYCALRDGDVTDEAAALLAAEVQSELLGRLIGED